MFVVFEGIDGSGKTTQSKNFAEAIGADWTCEPTHGPIGKLIREGLTVGAEWAANEVMSRLFAADRHAHLADVAAWVEDGKTVVSDRYIMSSMAYQSEDEYQARCIYWINTEGKNIRVPDLTIFLDVEPEEAVARIIARGGRTERYETLDYLVGVRERYFYALDWLGSWPQVRVDASGTQEEVMHRVLGAWRGFHSASPA